MSYRDEVLADNPVAYWRLNEPHDPVAGSQNVSDESGNGHTAEARWVTLGQTGFYSGLGTAAFLDGTATDSSRIILPAVNTDDALDGWSWEIWVNVDPTSNVDGTIGLFGEVSNENAAIVRLAPVAWDTEEDRPFIEARLRQRDLNSSHAEFFDERLDFNTDYHLVVTVEDAQTPTATVRVYLDGVEADSEQVTGPLMAPYREQDIGTRDNNTRNFVGVVDEPAFYADTLSAARVAAHWDARNDAPSGPDPEDLTVTMDSDTATLTWTAPDMATATDTDIFRRGPYATEGEVDDSPFDPEVDSRIARVPVATLTYDDEDLDEGFYAWQVFPVEVP